MLSSSIIGSICKTAQCYWEEEAKGSEIVTIAKGKEIGHKLADLVDEKTTELLAGKFNVKHQLDAQGNVRARSMGDLWLEDGGIFHPINVKMGVVGSEGQPNLVSMKKVLAAIFSGEIDSYYLLIVKLDVQADPIGAQVFLVDMLDIIEYITFDSGPGQIMLKATKFFSDFGTGGQPKLSLGTGEAPESDLKAKVKRLMALYEDGERRLIENREKGREKYRTGYKCFMDGECLEVNTSSQGSLRLG